VIAAVAFAIGMALGDLGDWGRHATLQLGEGCLDVRARLVLALAAVDMLDDVGGLEELGHVKLLGGAGTGTSGQVAGVIGQLGGLFGFRHSSERLGIVCAGRRSLSTSMAGFSECRGFHQIRLPAGWLPILAAGGFRRKPLDW